MSIDKFDYPILQTTINNTDFNIPQEILKKSRPVSKKEKSDGYGLSKMIHVYNIDKSRQFSTINKLIGQTIKVGNNNTVAIKNIECTDKDTKITFKIEGNGAYYYENINSAVVLDENYKDTERAEDGDVAVMEDINNRIVSIKLPPIDKTKQYKIALPIIDEPQIEEQYKVSIDLSEYNR